MYVSIGASTMKGKKMMAVFYDAAKKRIRTTHFGASGYQSYLDHQDMQRKMNYIARHKDKEDWNDYMTAGSLSYWILWNKPTFTCGGVSFFQQHRVHV